MHAFKKSKRKQQICLGQGKRFGNIPCDYYVETDGNCRLLRQGRLEEIYELGRCLSIKVIVRKVDKIYTKSFASNITYDRANSNSLGNTTHYDQDNLDLADSRSAAKKSHKQKLQSECEDIDLDLVIKKLMQAKLHGYTIDHLYGYLAKIVRSQISESLRARGIPLRKGKCGTCKYFPDSRPRICQLEELLDNEVSSVELTPNPFFSIERKWDDPSCPGYQNRKAPFKPIGDQKDGNRATDKSIKDGEDEHRKTEARLDMYHLFSMLKDCYEQAETAKQKEIYAVISEDIGFIYEKLRDGCSFEEGRSSLLDFKTSSQKQRGNYSKMLRRNLKRVEECLDQKKMSE